MPYVHLKKVHLLVLFAFWLKYSLGATYQMTYQGHFRALLGTHSRLVNTLT